MKVQRFFFRKDQSSSLWTYLSIIHSLTHLLRQEFISFWYKFNKRYKLFFPRRVLEKLLWYMISNCIFNFISLSVCLFVSLIDMNFVCLSLFFSCLKLRSFIVFIKYSIKLEFSKIPQTSTTAKYSKQNRKFKWN